MATTVAATVATAVAAIAVMAAAVATTIATIAAVATAAAMAKGQRLAVTAHEGNANQREEQGESEHNDTIHPQILQLLTGTVSENDHLPSSDDSITAADGSASRRDRALQLTTSFAPKAIPVVKIYGLRRM